MHDFTVSDPAPRVVLPGLGGNDIFPIMQRQDLSPIPTWWGRSLLDSLQQAVPWLGDAPSQTWGKLTQGMDSHDAAGDSGAVMLLPPQPESQVPQPQQEGNAVFTQPESQVPQPQQEGTRQFPPSLSGMTRRLILSRMRGAMLSPPQPESQVPQPQQEGNAVSTHQPAWVPPPTSGTSTVPEFGPSLSLLPGSDVTGPARTVSVPWLGDAPSQTSGKFTQEMDFHNAAGDSGAVSPARRGTEPTAALDVSDIAADRGAGGSRPVTAPREPMVPQEVTRRFPPQPEQDDKAAHPQPDEGGNAVLNTGVVALLGLQHLQSDDGTKTVSTQPVQGDKTGPWERNLVITVGSVAAASLGWNVVHTECRAREGNERGRVCRFVVAANNRALKSWKSFRGALR